MNVDLWTKVNGNYEQQGNTSDMIFAVYEMLSYFSHHMRMVPGDILATGTPPGVGMGKNRFLAVGDVLECGISNLVDALKEDRDRRAEVDCAMY